MELRKVESSLAKLSADSHVAVNSKIETNKRYKKERAESNCFLPVLFRTLYRAAALCYNCNIGSADLAAVLRIAFGVESNLLAFLQGLESVSIDSGEMYEHLFAGCIICDETITLLCVEPFYCTVIQCGTSLKNISCDSKT